MSSSTKFSSHEKILRLVTSAIMIALATVLSLITIYKAPLGGSITPLSMLPICLISLKYGVAWGMGTSFVYSLVQLGLDFSAATGWGLTKESLIACFVLDYILAFSVLGLAGIFRKKGYAGMCIGIGLAVFLRFVCHVLSGYFVFDIWCPWGNVLKYSIAYNGAFMLPELVITVAASAVLLKLPQIKNLIVNK